MEHPGEPYWEPRAPSSWRLPEITWLLQQNIADEDVIDRCMFGASAKKPTILAAIKIPQLGDNIRMSRNQGRCDWSHQHVTLKGRNPDGSFVTAPYKQYQCELNTLLANSFLQQITTKLKPD